MLESDIKELYERMAASDQRPSKISIPGASRTGRARLIRRRASAAAAPLLAAVAVVAIALTGAIPGGVHARKPVTRLPGGAPRYFSPLVPYARFGWLPANIPRYLISIENYYFLSPDLITHGTPGDVQLWVYAAGLCHITGHTMKCAGGVSLPFTLGRRVAEVDAHPAYWTAHSVYPDHSQSFRAGTLAWQYATGGWALLTAPTEGIAVKVAAHVQFGYAGEPAVRFPVQLTHVPANWQVDWLSTSKLGGVMFADSYQITAGPLTVPLGPTPDRTPFFSVSQGARYIKCTSMLAPTSPTGPPPSPEHVVINGYNVVVGTNNHWPNQVLCAPDAAGTNVQIAVGAQPTLSPASIFAHHLRLLGWNPAKWTAKPIN
jgi:hypothetical protein